MKKLLLLALPFSFTVCFVPPADENSCYDAVCDKSEVIKFIRYNGRNAAGNSDEINYMTTLAECSYAIDELHAGATLSMNG
jgi:hypothetical protein